jgi:hypothetical protein
MCSFLSHATFEVEHEARPGKPSDLSRLATVLRERAFLSRHLLPNRQWFKFPGDRAAVRTCRNREAQNAPFFEVFRETTEAGGVYKGRVLLLADAPPARPSSWNAPRSIG